MNQVVYTHIHPHRENKASVSRKVNAEVKYINPKEDPPLEFCREPTSLNPIVQVHKDTKSSKCREKATAKFFEKELEKENELKKLASLKERINLVPTWEAREFVGEEIQKTEKFQNQDFNDRFQNIDVNELNAFEQAELELQRIKSSKKTKRIADQQFQIRTERRIRHRKKVDNLISNSLSADIVSAQEHIYLQFLKTITRENDRENREQKKGASSLYLRSGSGEAGKTELSMCGKKSNNRKMSGDKIVKKKKKKARGKLLRVGNENPSIVELHGDVDLLNIDGESDEESDENKSVSSEKTYTVPPASPNFLEKYEQKYEEMENEKNANKTGKSVGLKKVKKKYGSLLDSTRLQHHYNKKNSEQVAYARKIFMDHERSTISSIRRIRQGSELGRHVREKAEFTRDMQEANYIGEMIELQQGNDINNRPATAPPSSSKKAGKSDKKSKMKGNANFPGDRNLTKTEVGVEISGPSFSCTIDEDISQNPLF